MHVLTYIAYDYYNQSGQRTKNDHGMMVGEVICMRE